LREQLGYEMESWERLRYDRCLSIVRAANGDDAAFNRAWQEGRAMTLDEAVRFALDGSVSSLKN
jgi:hypothetical protein